MSEIDVTTKPKRKALKAFERKTPYVPMHDDPRAELRRLVQEHKTLTRSAQSIAGMCRDRVCKATGETMKSNLPADAKLALEGQVGALVKQASKLEAAMLRELKKLPVYKRFLANVYGLGPVVCAYLCAMVDIHKAVKLSNLRRFVGLAVIDGHLERPKRGQKLAYCAELRMRIYQAFAAMWKNACRVTAAHPHGATTKYLDVWRGYKHRMQHSERYNAEENTLLSFEDEEDERSGARAVIHATGWHKAADVLMEDLYVIWRTLEGLPVWRSYYTAKLGYQHGGGPIDPAALGPRMLTIEEALTAVGEVGAVSLAAPVQEAA